MKKIISEKNKIKFLKNFLKKKGCDYYLLPRTDRFMNEFISEEDERVKWLTGFSGSFAFVVVSLKKNLIFTDGRYIAQIKKEVSQEIFEIKDINKNKPFQWLKQNLNKGQKVMIDSWLFSSKNFNLLKLIINKKKGDIVLNNEILIDKIWKKKKKVKKKRISYKRFKASWNFISKKNK